MSEAGRVDRGRLLRLLGVGFGIAVTVGGMIGAALALVSLLGLVNAVLMSGTRVAYAVARDGGFGPLARVSPTGTPAPALLLTTGASMLLALGFTFEQMIAISAAVVVFVYVSGFLSLFVLRRPPPVARGAGRRPAAPRAAAGGGGRLPVGARPGPNRGGADRDGRSAQQVASQGHGPRRGLGRE